ncbi:14846_t:CDS:2 [Cetraspora pellucida]|uniref:14846_t:CDS:1 n=1 Tax=Cetraspora pellucida TaxID=1433469 RepID=A0ACA9LNS9_9GLOM|nr:14846_t:CDS:2 [Cetraspora pellucida]
MKNIHTIDSLRELNAKLLAKIAKLRKEKDSLIDKNVKLLTKEAEFVGRIIELEKNAEKARLRYTELNTRIVKLEHSAKENEEQFMKLEQKQSQSDKEKSIHIAKLDDNVRKIEQVSILIPKEQSSTSINTCKINSDDISEQIVSQCDDTSISDISDNTSNSDIYQESKAQFSTSLIHMEPKLLEEKKEDEFLDSIYKEKVSKEIIQKIRKKKLQDQDLSLVSHKKKGTDKLWQELFNTSLEPSSQDHSTCISKNTKSEQIKISETACPEKLESVDGSAKCMKDQASRANQEEIICWSLYGRDFELQVDEMSSKNKIDILRKKTQRAVKIYKLFEKIGLDKIRHIKNYSANSISELTNDQIQEIINYSSESQISIFPSLENTPEVSSEDNIIEIFRTTRLKKISPHIKLTTKTKISIPPVSYTEKVLSETEINTSSASQPNDSLDSKSHVSAIDSNLEPPDDEKSYDGGINDNGDIDVNQLLVENFSNNDLRNKDANATRDNENDDEFSDNNEEEDDDGFCGFSDDDDEGYYYDLNTDKTYTKSEYHYSIRAY